MVSRVAYEYGSYQTSEECLHAIRDHVRFGWLVVDVRCAERGPYTVVFRMDDRG